MAHVFHYVMTHIADSLYYADAVKSKPKQSKYDLKAGLRRFSDQGNAAVVKELTQFHTLKCFRPRDPSITYDVESDGVGVADVYLTKRSCLLLFLVL